MTDALTFAWDYALKLLWGWAGLALGLIGFVDLAERVFDRKFTISTRNKVLLSLAVLVIAQALAYRTLGAKRKRKITNCKSCGRKSPVQRHLPTMRRKSLRGIVGSSLWKERRLMLGARRRQ